jgi:hypothetical protein
MIGWLQNLNDDARRISLNQASLNSGINSKAIEKDWWVTFVLRLLFTSKYATYFAFKGGTSLSKGWGIIDRFSEDIDIALSSEAFGMPYKDKPSKTFVEQLRREGCLFTSNEIVTELRKQFEKLQIPVELYSVEVETIRKNMPDTDPQTIYVSYKSLFKPNPYLPERVKIEFSVRSQNDPSDNREMQTLLNNYNPTELLLRKSFYYMKSTIERMRAKRELIECLVITTTCIELIRNIQTHYLTFHLLSISLNIVNFILD